jgi:hypothetical protein
MELVLVRQQPLGQAAINRDSEQIDCAGALNPNCNDDVPKAITGDPIEIQGFRKPG